MKIAIRADSSREIGTGHIVRCQTLAQALRARGAEVTFICRAHEGHISSTLEADGFAVRMLAAVADVPPAGDLYARWLAVPEMRDADETLAALTPGTAWLVTDHYGLSRSWETRLRSAVGAVLAIDDLGRPHDGDILLDQNYSSAGEARYEGRLGEKCKQLLGPRFALLQTEYAALSAGAPRRDGDVGRILVFFGGADPANMTGKAIEALSDPRFAHIHVDAVAGASNPHAARLKQLAAARPRTTLHLGLPSLARLTAQADFALGAGGGAMWERCCLGLPTAVISIAENQVPASRDLDTAGIITYLGPQETVSVEQIRSAMQALVADSPRRQSMSEQSRLLVDGRGAQRVCEAMLPSGRDQLTLRPATREDSGFYFRLVNDPDVRRQSFRSDAVTWEGHKRWYEGKMSAAHSRLYVMEVRGLPVGQIRFDIDDGTALIDYSLDPVVRGRGWGTQLVALGLNRLAADAPADVLAEVRRENVASSLVFDRLGFERVQHEDRSSHRLSRSALMSRVAHPVSANKAVS